MAVKNALTKTTTKNQIEFMANGEKVTLTPETVRNYLVSGNKEAVTINELAVFMNLCKYNGLNPWIKEAYCIKYGSEPATMVVGKEAFIKRAEANEKYDGCVAGIVVITEEGTIEYRTGTLKLPGEQIVGGFAEVFRKDRTHSTRIEISFDEYAGRKKDGTLNGQWSKKPATMIRKVALVQALREAFPTNVGGMFTAEENGIEEPAKEIIVEATEMPQNDAEEAKATNTLSEDKKAENERIMDAADALFG